MEFRRAILDESLLDLQGTVVVIDVLRAFTTAAYAFWAGAADITLVATVAEALALRKAKPEMLIMGEVDGLPVEGFDFSNSPTEIAGQDLAGRHLVQRTSSGTQGVVLSRNASALLTSSFVCARGTAKYLRGLSPDLVTFVITGYGPGGSGDEDAACADYIEALVRGDDPQAEPYLQRVRESAPGRLFSNPAKPEFPSSDLEYALNLDQFDFAMLVRWMNGKLIMETTKPA
jgi:2-phosphosulfolactate phosphatase